MKTGSVSVVTIWLLLFRPSGAEAQFPVIDVGSITQAVYSLVELRQQGQQLKNQAEFLVQQARSWRDLDAEGWMNFGDNAMDLGFRASDVYRVASEDLKRDFEASFPDELEWDGRPLPSREQLALLVARTSAVLEGNAANGDQIRRARLQAQRVLDRARASDTDAQLAASQTEIQAMELDEAQRLRLLQMQNIEQAALGNRMRASQMAKEEAAKMQAEKAAESSRDRIARQRAREVEVMDSIIDELGRQN